MNNYLEWEFLLHPSIFIISRFHCTLKEVKNDKPEFFSLEKLYHSKKPLVGAKNLIDSCQRTLSVQYSAIFCMSNYKTAELKAFYCN